LSKFKIEHKKNECIVADQQQTIKVILNERDSLNTVVEKISKEKV
jgi:hypothetical protein